MFSRIILIGCICILCLFSGVLGDEFENKCSALNGIILLDFHNDDIRVCVDGENGEDTVVLISEME